jgi:hypothetical protein
VAFTDAIGSFWKNFRKMYNEPDGTFSTADYAENGDSPDLRAQRRREQWMNQNTDVEQEQPRFASNVKWDDTVRIAF